MGNAGSKGSWWLRSPGGNSHFKSGVQGSGNVAQSGFYVDGSHVAVRPALHLNLSDTSVWSYAGTVSSTGEENELPAPNPPVTPSPSVSQVPSATTSPSAGGSSVVGTLSAGQNPAVVTSPAPAQNTPVAAQEEVRKTDEKTTPAKVTGLRLKAKKKAIGASWKKVSGATGYEIQVSTLKKFKKKSIKTTKKTKLIISKLNSNKKYFVRVRAYSVTNGKKTYGKWSKITNIKTKK